MSETTPETPVLEQRWTDPARTINKLLNERNALADLLAKHSICFECGEIRPDDDRVRAGMKCARCGNAG